MGLLDTIFKPKFEREYARALKEGKYPDAIQLARDNNMDPTCVLDAAKAWLEQEWEKGNFEHAAEIGAQHRLSKKRTHDAADRALDVALKGRQIEKAIALIERYELDRKKLLLESDKLYQHEMDGENFKQAADIARRAGLDRERVEKAVSRAFKKAMREKDDATLAEMGQNYGDFDLDWERVRQARLNLVVEPMVGQVYGKALDVAARFEMGDDELEQAMAQAAEARRKYLEKLRSSMVVKEGGQQLSIPTPDELRSELESGIRKEREKRGAA
jgi:hypothetical protein